MRMRLISLSVLVISVFSLTPTRAQSPPPHVTVDYVFGERILFQATVHTAERVQEALVFYRSPGSDNSLVGDMREQSREDNRTRLVYELYLVDAPLPPFSQLEYWVEVTLDSGEKISTSPETLLLSDNLREWQQLQDGPIRVYWYSGDMAFALDIMDVARKGLGEIEDLLDLKTSQRVDIYVYPDIDTMASVFNAHSSKSVAGHSLPQAGVIVVALSAAPQSGKLIEQRIPHELTHITLYQATGPGYENLPIWLVEGMATLAELTPNPDYETLLNVAYENENLLPLDSLCRSFPEDASRELLAYAQSGSFASFLYQRFGSAGLAALVDSYADEKNCQYGAETALGHGLNELEQEWRTLTFGEETSGDPLINLLPWLLLLGVILATPLALTIIVLVRKKNLMGEKI